MISNLMIFLIVLMTIGASVAISFVIPFPFSLIPIAVANFFIIRYFIRRYDKMSSIVK
jgi:hypothetical protein